MTVSAVVRGGMLLLGFWNAIRVDDVGWKSDETVTSTWGRLRGAVAVASLIGMMVLCARAGVAGRTQSSTAATEQTKKPASKSKTTSAGRPTAVRLEWLRQSEDSQLAPSKTTKGKSAAASKKQRHRLLREADGADDQADQCVQGVGAVAADGAAVGGDAVAVGL